MKKHVYFLNCCTFGSRNINIIIRMDKTKQIRQDDVRFAQLITHHIRTISVCLRLTIIRLQLAYYSLVFVRSIQRHAQTATGGAGNILYLPKIAVGTLSYKAHETLSLGWQFNRFNSIDIMLNRLFCPGDTIGRSIDLKIQILDWHIHNTQTVQIGDSGGSHLCSASLQTHTKD